MPDSRPAALHGSSLLIACVALSSIMACLLLLSSRASLALRSRKACDSLVLADSATRSAIAHTEAFLSRATSRDGLIVWSDDRGVLWLAWPDNSQWRVMAAHSGGPGASPLSPPGVPLDASTRLAPSSLPAPELPPDFQPAPIPSPESPFCPPSKSSWRGTWIPLPQAPESCKHLTLFRWQLSDRDGFPDFAPVCPDASPNSLTRQAPLAPQASPTLSIPVPGIPAHPGLPLFDKSLRAAFLSRFPTEFTAPFLNLSPSDHAALAFDSSPDLALPPRQPDNPVPAFLAAGIARSPWQELPVIPTLPDFPPAIRARPTLDLNALAAAPDSHAAVSTLSRHIQTCLPQFGIRGGGLPPDAYLANLSAIILDMTDSDNTPRIAPALPDSPAFRGLEPMPVVSEFYWRYRWTGIDRQSGKTTLLLRVETFAELHNPWPSPISGTWQSNFSTPLALALGAAPLRRLDSPSLLRFLTQPSALTPDSSGNLWFPQIQLTLRPGEWKLVKAGSLDFRIPSSEPSIPSPIELLSPASGSAPKSGYVTRWNGTIADMAGGGCTQSGATLYLSTAKSRPNSKVRAVEAGHSYGSFSNFITNPGDPLVSWWLQSRQSANKWPENASPARRNSRAEILASSPGAHSLPYARVLPSQWPDGGIDAPSPPIPNFGQYEGTDPAAPQFLAHTGPSCDQPWLRPWNPGFLLSITQLGAAYDPLLRESSPLGVSSPNPSAGGGNTLRIGRPEHPVLDSPALHASLLLDILSANFSSSPDSPLAPSPLRTIDGQININTAPEDVLTALLLDTAPPASPPPALVLDSWDTATLRHATAPLPPALMPSASHWRRIAKTIIANRPILCWSQLARLQTSDGAPLWQSPLPASTATDAWQESHFARLVNRSTLQSRNFTWTCEIRVQSKSSSARTIARKSFIRTIQPNPARN